MPNSTLEAASHRGVGPDLITFNATISDSLESRKSWRFFSLGSLLDIGDWCHIWKAKPSTDQSSLVRASCSINLWFAACGPGGSKLLSLEYWFPWWIMTLGFAMSIPNPTQVTNFQVPENV